MSNNSRSKLRTRLSGEQNHRCACCGTMLTLLPGYQNASAVVQIDRALPRTWRNTVALCMRCNGNQANHESVVAYFAHVAQNGHPDRRTIILDHNRQHREMRKAHADKFALYRTLMSEGLGVPYKWELRGIINLPEERIREIAAKNIEKCLDRMAGDPKFSAFMRGKPRCADRARLTLARRSSKIRSHLSACQNHRCCYCGVPMMEDRFTWASGVRYVDSRAATIEHVINSEDGGSDRMENLVAACHACNNLRGRLRLLAEDYYDKMQSGEIVIDHDECNRIAIQARKQKLGSRRGHLVHA